MATQEVLEQVCENCDGRYCTVREYLKFTKRAISECRHTSDEHELCDNLISLIKNDVGDRLLFQFKCIEEYKWIKSQQLNRAISWDEATELWIDEGYATKFADVWKLGSRDIYFFFAKGTTPPRHTHHYLNRTFSQSQLVQNTFVSEPHLQIAGALASA